MEFIEFIEEYYIWLIVGGVILFMTLIGYIADKSNYIEKQKNKNKEKKDKVIEQKQKHITKKDEAFMKSIGDGKNLVLEEGNITYPIDFEEEIIIESKEEPQEKESAEAPDLKDIGISSFMQAEDSSFQNTQTGNSAIETPLENGVLNLDDYDNKSQNEEDIWKF